MRDSKVTATIAAAVTLGAFASIYVSVSGGLFGPPVDRAIHEAGGAMMAKEALALLQPGGEITVITRDTRAFKNPATDIQMASFRRTLRAGHAKIHAVLALQVDPLRPVRVPAGDFCQIVRDTPAGSVIVSFMGPPLLSEAQWLQLGNIKPALIAFCPGRMAEEVDLRPFLRAGVLKAAVVQRSGLGGTGLASRDSSGHSRRSFVTVTTGNLDQLPPSPAP
jgi:hypothetical protein